MPNAPSSSATGSKHVSFGEVTILSFPMVMGDNPAVSEGVPVQLDWEPVERQVQSLELYEYFRNNNSSSKRRRGKRLMISTERRGRIVLQAGYSLEDVAETVVEIEDVKKSRAESLSKSEGWDRIGLLLKSTGKLPKEIISGVFSAGKKIMPKQKSFRARSA